MSLTIRPGQTVEKDPHAEKYYVFNWADWLTSSATITAESVAISGGDGALNVTDEGIVLSSTGVGVLLTDGTLGQTYKVTCQITTDETPAQIDERSFYVRIVDK